MANHRRWVSVTAALFLSAGSATSGAESIKGELPSSLGTLAGKAQMPVNLNFSGEFAGQPFNCTDEFAGVGQTAATVSVSDYKLFVSNVRMIELDGNESPVTLTDDGVWQQSDVGLLDFETGDGNCTNGTAQTNTALIGSVEIGEYVGVAFDIGVPFNKNHADPTLAASPMNLTSMFWNWRGGYRFMRVDLAVSDRVMEHGSEHQSGHGGGRGWSLHVGSTGCEGLSPTMAPKSCANGNRISVTFEDFNQATNTLVIDPAGALTQVDVTSNTPETAPGCMSAPTDPECVAVFTELGLINSASQRLVQVR